MGALRKINPFRKYRAHDFMGQPAWKWYGISFAAPAVVITRSFHAPRFGL